MTNDNGLLSKIMCVAVGAGVVGKSVNIKIRGTSEEVMTVSSAMAASQQFHEELQRPGATIKTVMQKLNIKHASAKEFERILGCPWPL